MKKLIALAVLTSLGSAAMAASLNEAVSEALATHPDVLAAQARLEATQLDAREARGALLPRVDLNAGIGRERTDSPSTNFDSRTLTRRELGVTAIWALFDENARGEVARRLGISESEAAAFQDTSQRIVLEAAQAYTNLWRAEEQFDIALETREAHERLVDQTARRLENGVSSESELVQAQGRLSLALSNQVAALNNLQDAQATYRRVVGSLPEVRLTAPSLDWQRPASLEAAVDRAFSNHPVIAEAEADVREATGLARSADGRFKPRITAELGANRNEDINGIEGENENSFAMLRLNWNLYAGGGDQAAQRAAASRITEAQNLLNDAQREVVETTHQAWNALQATDQQLSFLGDYVDSARQTRDAYADQFTVNRRTLLEVLDSEVELFEARSSRVNAQADNIIADHRLATAQGDLLSILSLSN